MVWLKVTDKYPVNCAPLSDAAFRTHTESLCRAMEYLNRGHITRRDLMRYAETSDPYAAAEELVVKGFWVEHPSGDGWLIVRDMDYQRSPEKVEADRAATARRQARYRDRQAGNAVTNPVTNVVRNAGGNAVSNAAQTRPVNPSPPPPQRSSRQAPAGATPEGEGEGTPDARAAELAARVRELRPEWSTPSILRILTSPDVAERPWPIVTAAAMAVAADPATQSPGRLAGDGPWWSTAAGRRLTVAKPAWCGRCDEHTRQVGDPPARCPDCHPLEAAGGAR